MSVHISVSLQLFRCTLTYKLCLTEHQPELIRNGKSAMLVGCGYKDELKYI